MQLKFMALLLIASLVFASAQTFGQEKDLLSAEYSKCIEDSGGTDPGMLDCMGAEGDRQDKRLNDAYKKLMNELKPERKRQLQEAQRLWIKYIEANCDFYLDPDGGTAARLAASECPVLAKAAELRNLRTSCGKFASQVPPASRVRQRRMELDRVELDRGGRTRGRISCPSANTQVLLMAHLRHVQSYSASPQYPQKQSYDHTYHGYSRPS